MGKWMVFRAEKRQPGWKDRKYAHTGSLTKTLFEHYDCSDRALPEPGYRPPEFLRVDRLADSNYPEASTHYRQSDWEVTRVETYTPDIPVGVDFDMIVFAIANTALSMLLLSQCLNVKFRLIRLLEMKRLTSSG